MKTPFIFLLSIVLSSTLFAQKADQRKQLVPYRKGNLWGYADEKKKIVIAPKFEEASFFKEDNNLYYAEGKLNGKKIIIQEDGSYMDDEFSSDDGGWMALGGLEAIWFDEMSDDPSLSTDGKDRFSLIDNVFKKSPVYEYASDFLEKETVAIMTRKDPKKVGVVRNTGDVIIPFDYDDIICINRKTLIFAARKAGSWILLDNKNKRVSKMEFEEVYRPTFDGRVRVRQASKYGYLDVEGNVVIQPRYTKASDFGDDPAKTGYAWVEHQGMGFFIDKKGVEFVER